MGVVLGHLWYNSGTNFAGLISTALSGTPLYQDVRDWLPILGLTPIAPHTSLLPLECALLLVNFWPKLSCLASWSK
jgi:hypothetical protein